MRRRQLNNEEAKISKNREDQEQRDELLKPANPLNPKSERRNRQEKVTAKHTTQSLGSLVQRMNDEVKLSEQATMILTTSSSVLKDTGTQIHAIGQSIKSGGKLITKYGRRETTDKILLSMALLLYFAVILYILRKRVFTFGSFNYWSWVGFI